YTLGVFKKGSENDLQEKDLYQVLGAFKSKKLGDQFEKEWKKLTEKKNASIFRLLVNCYGTYYFLLGLSQFVVKISVITTRPFVVGKIVSYFVPSQTELSKNSVTFYGCPLIILTFVELLYNQHYIFMLGALEIRIRTALCSLIYRKALRLSLDIQTEDVAIGKIVTFFSKDVNSFEMFIDKINEIWICTFKAIVVSCILYHKIGATALVPIVLFFLLMPLQIFLGMKTTGLKRKMFKKTDERLQLTEEILTAIRIIKMYTKEMRITYRIFILKYFIYAIAILNQYVILFLWIALYMVLGHRITAEILYFMVTAYRHISYGLTVAIPYSFLQGSQTLAAFRRIDRFLTGKEVHLIQECKPAAPKIILKNVTIETKDKIILDSVNLEVEKSLILMTGPTGDGKTVLLKTILQNFQPTKGEVLTQGRMSYASQEPWFFPSTIRQNILFGEEYDEKHYREILRICALDHDFHLLKQGDLTIVESHASNLSKGQGVRINLARTVYRHCEIYLLDDSLSTLDALVTSFIYKECIKNFLRDKLVILVTQNVNFLKNSQNVITVHNGQVMSQVNTPENFGEITMNGSDNLIFTSTETDDEENENEKSKLLLNVNRMKVYEESKKLGQVDFDVYKKYVQNGGGVNLEEKLFNYTRFNFTHTSDYNGLSMERKHKFLFFGIILAVLPIVTLASALILYYFAGKASVQLHSRMIDAIINATSTFFDKNFIGNILNRFSEDLTNVDEVVPATLDHIFRLFLSVVGISILIISVNKLFFVPVAIMFIILIFLRRYYLLTGRSLKRLDAITKSPVIGHLNATLNGLATIRASKCEKLLQDEFDTNQDLYTSTSYTFLSTTQAFCLSVDFICFLFVTVVVSRFLIFDDGKRYRSG
ncbi:ABC tran domain containing protein, partial [Asbolus verrucosus]